MPHAFAQIAFTPQVKAEQQRDGSRARYARSFEADAETSNDRLGQAETDFFAQLRSFCRQPAVDQRRQPGVHSARGTDRRRLRTPRSASATPASPTSNHV
jgi:hypothetical protein